MVGAGMTTETTKFKVIKKLPKKRGTSQKYLFLGKDVDVMTERQLRNTVKRLMDSMVPNYV